MLNSKCVVAKPGPVCKNGVVPLETSLGGSWGLSKWVNNGDNWGYYMALGVINLLTVSGLIIDNGDNWG